MIRIRIVLSALVAVAVAATTTVTTPAGAAAPPASPHAVLALIVTNNRSEQLGRPDLRYADDDGAKYYELFRTLAPADQVALLTELDADTARLFPSLLPIAQPPTRANVARSAERLARQADALRARGVAVDFYFIFAGHGDVDRGRGFIALADGAVNADDLEALVLRRVPASSLHIILDSCNAFFVINPRKPGGRRFPTPQEAAAEISARLPHAGVFLSTSAEAQVYEWSELQSGIFSHAVRSGLAGAADANGDGRISYSELAAFVSLASQDVRNPLYRPTVFARGPGGDNGAPLLDWSTTAAPLLELPAGEQRRVTVRDADELPWIDVHAEADHAVRLHLPARLAAHVAVDERALDETGAVLLRRQGQPSAEGPTLLADLGPRPDGGDARGPSDIFRGLFARPFGPHALAAWLADAATRSPPPLGIALEEVGRMRLLLGHTAAIERNRRKGAFATECLGGGVAMGLGAWILAGKPSTNRAPVPFFTALTLLSDGLYACLGGIGRITQRSASERIFEEFEAKMAQPGVEQARVVAATEQRLFRLYHEERVGRRRNLFRGWALAGIGAIGLGLTALHNDASPSTMTLTRVALGFMTAVGIEAGVQASFETPVERMVRLWAEDPGIQRIPRVGIFAAPGGASISISGQF